jgi:mRNA interferase MazF
MKRGDVIIGAGQGDYGKPRPMLVVQADAITGFDTVSVALITTTLIHEPRIRPAIAASETNGLRELSEVMVDKIQPLKRSRAGAVIGQLDGADMEQVTRAITVVFGIAN